MASSELLKAPQCPDLPALPSDGFWSETQWAVFMAIMDTIVPSVVPKSSLTDKQGQLGVPDSEYLAASKTTHNIAVEVSGDDALRAYFEDRPSTNLAVRGVMIRRIALLPIKQQEGLGKLMSSLSCVHLERAPNRHHTTNTPRMCTVPVLGPFS